MSPSATRSRTRTAGASRRTRLRTSSARGSARAPVATAEVKKLGVFTVPGPYNIKLREKPATQASKWKVCLRVAWHVFPLKACKLC
uniref:Histone-like protein n=1 Tax=Alexandrium fundyense TaxID=2932 RepID=Q9XEI7_ALEFU|nr:histone-like protein [Alexandrium fundyense]